MVRLPLIAVLPFFANSVLNGKLVDFDGHMQRLQRSLRELDFAYEPDANEYLAVHRELLARNGNLQEGVVYWQVTRGVATDRAFTYDNNNNDLVPTVLGMTQKMSLVHNPMAQQGLRVMTIPDLRWGRRDIKTTQLLYQAAGKMQAKAAGFDDAWLVDPYTGLITEGTSNNAFIVTNKGNTLVTRATNNDILHGITRATVLRLCQEIPLLNVEERSFTVEEVMDASTTIEAFSTSSSSFVLPVVEMNSKPIGNGQVGPIARRLREIYIEEAQKSSI